MLRDPNLVPLSRQHQHALALCVRIQRAPLSSVAELEQWQAEIELSQQTEIELHFQAEEQFIFPEARQLDPMRGVVEELIAEHSLLRQGFAKASARSMNAADLTHFAQQLTAHIRKEERQLFETMQKCMTAEQLARIGAEVDKALQSTTQACVVPSSDSV